MHKLLITTIAATGLAVSTDAMADPTNIFGGRVNGERHAYVKVGYPALEGGVRLYAGDLEMTPRFGIEYPVFAPRGTGLAGLAANVGILYLGIVPGFDVRYQLLETGDLTGALVGGIDLTIEVGTNGQNTGVGIGLLQPGWMMTYRIEDVVDLDFGIIFSPMIDITPGGGTTRITGDIRIPIVIGAEYEVTDGIVIGARLGVGPWIRASSAGGQSFTSTDAFVDGSVFAGFDF